MPSQILRDCPDLIEREALFRDLVMKGTSTGVIQSILVSDTPYVAIRSTVTTSTLAGVRKVILGLHGFGERNTCNRTSRSFGKRKARGADDSARTANKAFSSALTRPDYEAGQSSEGIPP